VAYYIDALSSNHVTRRSYQIYIMYLLDYSSNLDEIQTKEKSQTIMARISKLFCFISLTVKVIR